MVGRFIRENTAKVLLVTMVIFALTLVIGASLNARNEKEHRDFCHSKGMEFHSVMGDTIVCKPIPRGYRKYKMEEE